MDIKIDRSGKGSQVEDCFTKVTPDSLSIYINTKDRYIEPEYYITGKDKPNGVNQIEFGFECGDLVSVTAENKEESDWLGAIRFECHCKDQLWFYFPKEFVKI